MEYNSLSLQEHFHYLIFRARTTFKNDVIQRNFVLCDATIFAKMCTSWRILGKIFPVSRKFISTVFDPKELNRTSNAAAENPPPSSPLSIFVRSINWMNLTNVFYNLQRLQKEKRLLTNFVACQNLFLLLF